MVKIKKLAVKAKKTVKKKVKKVKIKKAAVKQKAPPKKKIAAAKKPGAGLAPKTAPLASSYKAAANELFLGEIEDYFTKIGVLALTLKEGLSLGNIIHIHGHTTDLTQKVESMQIERQAIQAAKKGDSVGIKAIDRCRKGDKIFRVN